MPRSARSASSGAPAESWAYSNGCLDVPRTLLDHRSHAQVVHLCRVKCRLGDEALEGVARQLLADHVIERRTAHHEWRANACKLNRRVRGSRKTQHSCWITEIPLKAAQRLNTEPGKRRKVLVIGLRRSIVTWCAACLLAAVKRASLMARCVKQEPPLTIDEHRAARRLGGRNRRRHAPGQHLGRHLQ
jgi:hypothetical protein